MTSMIKGMIQSSLGSFASQFNASSGSKGDASHDQAPTISQDPDRESERDQRDPPVEEEGLFSEDDDPDLHHGDPNLSQLVLTEEEQQDFDSFDETSEALTSSQTKKGKPHYGRFPRKLLIFTRKLRLHAILNLVVRLARLRYKLQCLIY